jgi:hypothetical protein
MFFEKSILIKLKAGALVYQMSFGIYILFFYVCVNFWVVEFLLIFVKQIIFIHYHLALLDLSLTFSILVLICYFQNIFNTINFIMYANFVDIKILLDLLEKCVALLFENFCVSQLSD